MSDEVSKLDIMDSVCTMLTDKELEQLQEEELRRFPWLLKENLEYTTRVFSLLQQQVGKIKNHKYQRLAENLYTAMTTAKVLFEISSNPIDFLTSFTSANTHKPLGPPSKLPNFIIMVVGKDVDISKEDLSDEEKVLKNAGFVFHTFVGDDQDGDEFGTCQANIAGAEDFQPLTTDQLMEKLSQWCDAQPQERLSDLKIYSYTNE